MMFEDGYRGSELWLWVSSTSPTLKAKQGRSSGAETGLWLYDGNSQKVTACTAGCARPSSTVWVFVFLLTITSLENWHNTIVAWPPSCLTKNKQTDMGSNRKEGSRGETKRHIWNIIALWEKTWAKGNKANKTINFTKNVCILHRGDVIYILTLSAFSHQHIFRDCLF